MYFTRISLYTFISLLILPHSSLNPEKSFLFSAIGASINLWFSKHSICFGPVHLAVPPSSASLSIFLFYIVFKSYLFWRQDNPMGP
ncbi:hypothetical protein E2C01_060351 [Portunus trituberculatus]|uniref:Uncharacterized protein n=1 Tax=Portunus trituberculatus TaxID=210409 RepID=A0A5B7H980_PORTR|nr:hypothetical protein [Portunus trituberculatus]